MSGRAVLQMLQIILLEHVLRSLNDQQFSGCYALYSKVPKFRLPEVVSLLHTFQKTC
jgi:hypothetical protein